MNYFHETGYSYEEITKKLKSKYGENYQILYREKVPASGIRGLLGKTQIKCSGYILTGSKAREAQISRDRRSKEEILSSVGVGIPAAQPDKKKSHEAVDDFIRAIVQGVRGELSINPSQPPTEPFRVLSELAEILKENDFEPSYATKLTDALKNRFTAAELEDREKIHDAAALEIAQSVKFSQPNGHERIMILVGPTGVGKTTTIAKLAAIHGITGKVKKDVRIITVDNFRIGAFQQIETYGKIIGIPVKAADNYSQLRKEIALAADADLVLVDTIGKSPRDRERIEEMRAMLSACGADADIHLTLSATTKTEDIRNIIRHFRIFDYASIILSKLDETSKVGSLISILSEADASVSYITDGQSVPFDIALASPMRLLGMIKGLDFNSALFVDKQPSRAFTWKGDRGA